MLKDNLSIQLERARASEEVAQAISKTAEELGGYADASRLKLELGGGGG